MSAPGSAHEWSSGFERSLAVVIGVNAYAHGVPPLHNAVRDAAAVGDALERQGFEVLRLLDDQASLQALSELLSVHLPALQPPLDRLLIYFAGHGLAHTDEQLQLSGFLLPADARRDVPSSYWPMASLREALRTLNCRHLLLILDCCFAGAFPHGTVRDLRPSASSSPLYLERFRHFTSHRSFQLLLSTAHDELASDRLLAKPSQETLGDGQHSPFALALLQALQPRSPADFNQDGLLTASELYTFLRDRLVGLLPSHQQQTPSLWNLDWHDRGEFLFCLGGTVPALPAAAPLSKDINPYLGLRPFSAAQRHLFFGRERGIGALSEHLRAHPLLLLCGPSGAGKSSLVHAGLLPHLSESSAWQAPASLRPSSRPLHALAAWLSSVEPGAGAPSAAALATRPEDARDFLRSVLSRRPELSLLLVVDPLEELVTACLDNHRRGAFLRALSSLLGLAHPRLRVVLLLRSDFEPHFLSLLPATSFALPLWHASRVTVSPMNRDELRRCIEKPAEARTLFFAPGLVERLLDDVEQMPGALPLLSVALSELFDAHLDSGRADRTLSFADYERLGGGIAGALQRRAELVFSGAPAPMSEGYGALPLLPALELPAFQRTLRNVLLRMASPEGGGPTRRRVRRAELEYAQAQEHERVQRALLTLEASRLIVASDDGGPCVEPAHDALLTAWPRLHDWVRQAQRELLLLRRISHAASEWARQGHTVDFLWPDTRLDQLGLAPAALRDEHLALALPTSAAGGQPTEPLVFNAEESAFLRASLARRRFLRRRRHSLQLMAAASILLLAVIAFFQKGLAEENARQFLQEKLRAEANEGEAHRQEQAALASAQEARRQKQAAEANAQEAAQQEANAKAQTLEAHRQEANAKTQALEASRQQANAEAQAEEARRQRELAQAQAEEANRQRELARDSAQRASEQEEAALASAQEAQRQQEAAEASALRAQQQERAALDSAHEAQRQRGVAEHSAAEATRQQLQASLNAQEARTQRDVADTNARRAQDETQRALFSAKLAQAESLLQTDPTRAALVLQEAIRSAPSSDLSWLQTALALHQQEVSEAILMGVDHSVSIPPRFSPDGAHVLALSGNSLYLWQTQGTGQPRVLTNAGDPLYSATFSPDSSLVLAAASDALLLWRTDGATAPRVLLKDLAAVDLGDGSFSPDGSRLLITARSRLYLWRTDTSAPPTELVGTRFPWDSAAFSPDGSLILASASDGTTQLWNPTATGQPLTLSSASTPAYSARFSPDGAWIAARSGAALLLWSTHAPGTPQRVHTLTGFLDSFAFNLRGDQILATSSQGEVLVWRVASAAPPVLLSPPGLRMHSARFSPDGRQVLAVAGNTTYLWDLKDSGVPRILASSCDYMSSAQFSPDGARIATLCLNGTIELWRTQGPAEPQVLSTSAAPANSITFSPDGLYAVTNAGSSAQLWRTDLRVAPRALNGHTQDVQHLVFSADGTHLLTTAGSSLRVWRTHPRDSLTFPRSVTPGVAGAALSPDGTQVVTTSFDQTVHLWSTLSPSPPRTIAEPSARVMEAAFTPDGSNIWTASFEGLHHLWHTAGPGAPVPTLATEDPWGGLVQKAQPLHHRLGSRLLRIWPAVGISIESVEGKQPPMLLFHTGLSQAFFFQEGLRVATVASHELRLWPLAPHLMSASLSQMTTACLSRVDRISLLQESASQAEEGFSRCERSHGRLPGGLKQAVTSNPIDEPAFFVTQLYLDLLERPPTSSERRHAISPLRYCGRHAVCMASARLSATRTLFESAEHRSRQNLFANAPDYAARYVTRAYTGLARRRPEGGGELFWRTGIHHFEAYSEVLEGSLVASGYRERFGPP